MVLIRSKSTPSVPVCAISPASYKAQTQILQLSQVEQRLKGKRIETLHSSQWFPPKYNCVAKHFKGCGLKEALIIYTFGVIKDF